jgi:hypothetical protein
MLHQPVHLLSHRRTSNPPIKDGTTIFLIADPLGMDEHRYRH